MMRHGDEEQFVEALKSAFEVAGGAIPSKRAIGAWWDALDPFPVDHVVAALNAHIAESVYPPKPADVISRIGQADGRPGAEEAWGIALAASDESDTVVWTDEIAVAKSACDEILSAGDKIGARKAFLERYQREVSEARAQQRPVRWRPSLGHDPDQRISAIRAAYEQGRIGNEAVHQHLPKLSAVEITGARDESEQKLLTDESAEKQGATGDRVTDQKARENLRSLRALVAGAAEPPATPEGDAGQAERTQAWGASRADSAETATAGE